MALFNKKTTLVHHITYMGLMTAINVIFIVLATYVPPFMLLLILLLPFASTIVSYYCLKRYYIIYAIASIGLCLIFNISDTIFYVVPAVTSGFAIGVLLEKRVHSFWLVLVSTVINAALTYGFIPLINLISGTDFVLSLLTIFKLQDFAYRTELVYLFIFFTSLMQCALTHFVLLSDAKKIGIEINTRVECFAPYLIGLGASIVLAVGLAFLYLPIALVFVGIALYFASFLLIDLLLSKKLPIYLMLAASIFAMILVFAIIYNNLSKPFGAILTLLFPFAIGIVSFVKNYLLKYPSNI